VPKGTERVSQTGISGFSLVKESKHLDEAWKLLEYLTYDPIGAHAFTSAVTEVPALMSIGKRYVETTSAIMPGINANVFVDAMINTWNWKSAESPAFDSLIYPAITGALEKVVLEEKGLAQAMEEIRPLIEAGLETER